MLGFMVVGGGVSLEILHEGPGYVSRVEIWVICYKLCVVEFGDF